MIPNILIIIFLGYIIDLKDIYLALGWFSLVIFCIKNLQCKWNRGQEKIFIKNYFKFIKTNLYH